MKKRITMKSTTEATVTQAVDLYLQKCRVKNLAEKTLSGYAEELKMFTGFCGDKNITEVTAETVDEFTLLLKDSRNISDVSVATYLRPLRAFLYFCMDAEMITPFKIQIPKAEKKIKETYTDDELDKLLKKPNMKVCSFTEFKVWTFENYLLGTGNRLTTALNIRVKDVDFEGGLIILGRTKNRRQQIIPLSQTLSDILREYLMIRGGNNDDYMFCTNTGMQGTTSGYQTLVRRYNHSRGVNRTSIHAFRHTFAKHWILSGGDVFRLQKIMGHSDITVTKEYVEMFAADLQKDFDRFNPLDARVNTKGRIKMRKA